MITEKDLQEAIAECQGERHPNASTCIKLAAFFIIKNELYPAQERQDEPFTGYSYESRENGQILRYTGESEFAGLIDGMESEKVCRVMDELMMSLQVIEPRLYAAVLRKIRGEN